MESILNTIKKLLNIQKDCDHFDDSITVLINSVFLNLHQLGIGPDEGFSITGEDDTWDDFIGDSGLKYEAVKTYVYLKVWLLFDCPTNSSLISHIQSQIAELEWRLNVQKESYDE